MGPNVPVNGKELSLVCWVRKFADRFAMKVVANVKRTGMMVLRYVAANLFTIRCAPESSIENLVFESQPIPAEAYWNVACPGPRANDCWGPTNPRTKQNSAFNR
jgi:hypothetical protein